MAPATLTVPARKRTVRACDQCRRRKVKCNGKLGCTECNSIGLECSYGSQIKQSRRRNYLIHLEQKVQRLEHELRSARTTAHPDALPHRRHDVSTDHSIANGIQDCNPAGLDVGAMNFWNNSYKPFEQPSGSSEWVGSAPEKPFLPELIIPSQCLQSSDFIYRADSLSPSTPQTASSATWTPCTGEMFDFWPTIPDHNCSQPMVPGLAPDASQWYHNRFDQQTNPSEYHHGGLPFHNGHLAACPPGYN